MGVVVFKFQELSIRLHVGGDIEFDSKGLSPSVRECGHERCEVQ